VHAERLRAGRLPEAVVLEHPRSAVAAEAGGDAACPLAQHLRGDEVVRPPAVADLPGHVLAIAPALPVDLVGGDPGGVVALEDGGEALAEDLDGRRWDKALLDDEKAVLVEALDLIVCDVLNQFVQVA
jgi:hypothetical protein